MRASQRGAINVIPEGKRGRTLEGLPAKVVVDGNLITGQNPQSAKAVAEELVKRLKKS